MKHAARRRPRSRRPARLAAAERSHLAAFARLGQHLSAAGTRQEAAQVILDAAESLLGWHAGYLHLCDPKRDWLEPVLVYDTLNGRRAQVPSAYRDRRLSAMDLTVVRRGAQLILRDHRRFEPSALIPFGDTARPSASMMFVPIRSRARVIGILSIQSYTPRAYSQADLQTLQALADHCGGALERVRAQEAFRQAEASYRGMFENAVEGLFRVSADGRFLAANPALAFALGYETPEQILSAKPDIWQRLFVSPERRKELAALLASNREVRGFEVQLYRRDGMPVWMSLNALTVRDAGGALLHYEGSARDVTDSKQRAEAERDRLLAEVTAARDQARLLTQQLVEVQEAERRRIASELHDEIGQGLTGLKLTLDMTERLPQSVLKPRLDQARAEVNRLIARVRELSLDLRPTMLDDFGLLSALLWHFDRYTKLTHVRVRFTQAGLENQRFSQQVETAAYRIVQEALTNVARHAGVKEVEVRCATGAGALTLEILDHGAGFDLRKSDAAGASSGLSGMRERAAFTGGRLAIETAPGAGTRLVATLPLHATAPGGTINVATEP